MLTVAKRSRLLRESEAAAVVSQLTLASTPFVQTSRREILRRRSAVSPVGPYVLDEAKPGPSGFVQMQKCPYAINSIHYTPRSTSACHSSRSGHPCTQTPPKTLQIPRTTTHAWPFSHIGHRSALQRRLLFGHRPALKHGPIPKHQPTLEHNLLPTPARCHIRYFAAITRHHTTLSITRCTRRAIKMGQPPTLETLPVEIISAIAVEANHEDLLAFRLSCKSASASTDNVFINAYFTRRTHVFTEYGLRALLDITAEQRLARKLGYVTIVGLCMANLIYAYSYDGSPAQTTTLAVTGLPISQVDAEPSRAQASDLLRAEWKWEKEQQRLSNGMAVQMLTKAFNDIASARESVSIAVDTAREPPYYGLSMLLRSFAPLVLDKYSTDCETCRNVIRMIFHALSHSQISIDHLDLCAKNYTPITAITPILPYKLSRQVTSRWESLSFLRLGFIENSEFIALDALGVPNPKKWRPLTAMLEYLVSLEELQFVIIRPDHIRYDFSDHNIVKKMATAVPVGRLRKLVLRGMSGTEQHYADLFTKHCATLQELVLDNAVIPMVGNWMNLLERVLQTMSIQHLHLRDLCVGDQPSYVRIVLADTQGRAEFEWRHMATVSAGLRALLQNGQYMEGTFRFPLRE